MQEIARSERAHASTASGRRGLGPFCCQSNTGDFPNTPYQAGSVSPKRSVQLSLHYHDLIASTTMNLTARTMGLEATYIGLFEFASKSYEPLIEELGLPPGHEVFSVLIMGYPILRFLRTVDRKPIKIKWA